MVLQLGVRSKSDGKHGSILRNKQATHRRCKLCIYLHWGPVRDSARVYGCHREEISLWGWILTYALISVCTPITDSTAVTLGSTASRGCALLDGTVVFISFRTSLSLFARHDFDKENYSLFGNKILILNVQMKKVRTAQRGPQTTSSAAE